MKFPSIPGKTPREQFENLARLLITTAPTALEEKKRRKRRKRAAAVVGLLVLLLFGGCSARKQVAPESWVKIEDGTPATKADTDVCRPYLAGTSLENLDAHLAVFRECMRDHGFKMK
jgi:hypothetical protein